MAERIKKSDLDKLAEEELLREAKRGASRAAVLGAMAWKKCPLKPTNKRFLLNMIQNNISSNNLKDDPYRRHRKLYHKSKHKHEHSEHDSGSVKKKKYEDSDYESNDINEETKHHRSGHNSEKSIDLNNSADSSGSRTSSVDL